MLLFLIWFITPVLGAMRNYAKYHTVNPTLFIRTPVLTVMLYTLWNNYTSFACPVLLSAISERWVMLFYKMCVSWYKDDYHKKKDKYVAKYNLNYSD